MHRRAFLSGVVILLAAACAPRIPAYSGPAVTRIVVNKGARRMYLLHDKDVLRSYDIDLGQAPVGRKQVSGDAKTPEGSYYIDRLNPNSDFHLSLGISYPNADDRARARALGKDPGGDIFIHGGPRPTDGQGRDWTYGCISVSNKEIAEIYSMVRVGTQIDIFP